jgi:hypothetical protein
LLFPDKSLVQGLWQLGYQNAQNDMKGIYKVLLKIATVEMVIKKASVIWKTYHDEGKSSAQQVKDKQFVFLVENYPDLPKTYRIITEGYITALANLVGEKYVEVVCDDVEPSAWKWLITIN